MNDGVADEIVTFRLGPKDRAAIERLVSAGEFRNRSDFLRYAVKTALREFEAEPNARAALDLEIEGYELPAHSQDAPRARQRARRGEVRSK